MLNMHPLLQIGIALHRRVRRANHFARTMKNICLQAIRAVSIDLTIKTFRIVTYAIITSRCVPVASFAAESRALLPENNFLAYIFLFILGSVPPFFPRPQE